MSIFRLYQWLKFFLNTVVLAKTYFEYFCCDARLFYVRWIKNFYLLEPMKVGTRSWSSVFIIQKYLDYMQYYMLMLKHSGKFSRYCYMFGWWPSSCLLGHVTGLCFYFFVELLSPSIFKFLEFEAVTLAFCSIMSWPRWTVLWNWAVLLIGKFKDTRFVLQNVQTHQTIFFLKKKHARKCKEKRMFGLKWASQHSR